MDQKINDKFSQWLDETTDSWKTPKEQRFQNLAWNEIDNRITFYPSVRESLNAGQFNLERFAKIIEKCWALGSRYQHIRFRRFVSDESAASTIKLFINDFPENDVAASERINNFIDQLVGLGYTKTVHTSSDFAGAAALSSVVLTSLFPDRFVDFLPTRWKTFSDRFDYSHPFPEKESYGEKIIWAGKFAAALADTKTFKKYWPNYERLWVVAGICWKWDDLQDTTPEDEGTEEDLAFREGEETTKTIRQKKRNLELIKLAKNLRRDIDPMLRCDVCHFSFLETYG
ncbi:MAG: hypothetical protein WCP36_10135, partial [Methanomicrobiales archaeon]